MQLTIHKDYQQLSQSVARILFNQIKEKPDSVLCLASGDTPKMAYQLFVEIALKENLDLGKCTFIGLDEWVGVPPFDSGSCHYFFEQHLFGPLKISPEQVHLFDAMSKDLEDEVVAMNRIIEQKKGIDLMLVGIGMNGHIGFNEPGVSFDSYAHVVDLDETTRKVGRKYFEGEVKLSRGITLGLRHLTECRQALLLANGLKKAEVIKKALEGVISPMLPASIIQTHKGSRVEVDEEAASMLNLAHQSKR